MAACAAAAVLTSVLARAESFMLATAGHTLELSDGCSWSTPRSRSCNMMAQLLGLQAAWPPASSLLLQMKALEAAADGGCREVRAQPGLPLLFARFSADDCWSRVACNSIDRFRRSSVLHGLLWPQRQAQKAVERA